MPKTTVINIKNAAKNSYKYIGRGSDWGNPFSYLIGTKATYLVKDREEAIRKFKEWITEGEGVYLLPRLNEIQGKVLGCYCKPLACHGDVLAELCDAHLGQPKPPAAEQTLLF